MKMKRMKTKTTKGEEKARKPWLVVVGWVGGLVEARARDKR